MSGFWITLYENRWAGIRTGVISNITGYLYCCESEDCVVTRVQQKSELEVCPKCGETVTK